MVRRDPHEVLGVAPGANAATIKAAWRRLAREHHPDLAANAAERRAATRRMATINAAYAELRDAAARSDVGSSPAARRSGQAGGDPTGTRFERPSGPPPPPPTPPVTARLDTTDTFHARNATTTPNGGGYRHRPRASRPPRARAEMAEPPRASDPTGPLERLRGRRGRRRAQPSLAQAEATTIVFGKFHGHTLGEIATREPSYLAWLARAITRDPDLLDAARVVCAALAMTRGDGGGHAAIEEAGAIMGEVPAAADGIRGGTGWAADAADVAGAAGAPDCAPDGSATWTTESH